MSRSAACKERASQYAPAQSPSAKRLHPNDTQFSSPSSPCNKAAATSRTGRKGRGFATAGGGVGLRSSRGAFSSGTTSLAGVTSSVESGASLEGLGGSAGGWSSCGGVGAGAEKPRLSWSNPALIRSSTASISARCWRASWTFWGTCWSKARRWAKCSSKALTRSVCSGTCSMGQWFACQWARSESLKLKNARSLSWFSRSCVSSCWSRWTRPASSRSWCFCEATCWTWSINASITSHSDASAGHWRISSIRLAH